jgi:hypothetical protein
MGEFICVLLKSVDHSSNYSFEFFEISFSSLLLESATVELLTFGVVLPFFFFIFLVFLCWNLHICGLGVVHRF